jgi:hypothetical protein
MMNEVIEGAVRHAHGARTHASKRSVKMRRLQKAASQ